MYAIFSRSDAGYWQGVAGGGEDDETPIQAARRELAEEAGILDTDLYQLKSFDMVPVINFLALAGGPYLSFRGTWTHGWNSRKTN